MRFFALGLCCLFTCISPYAFATDKSSVEHSFSFGVDESYLSGDEQSRYFKPSLNYSIRYGYPDQKGLYYIGKGISFPSHDYKKDNVIVSAGLGRDFTIDFNNSYYFKKAVLETIGSVGIQFSDLSPEKMFFSVRLHPYVSITPWLSLDLGGIINRQLKLRFDVYDHFRINYETSIYASTELSGSSLSLTYRL